MSCRFWVSSPTTVGPGGARPARGFRRTGRLVGHGRSGSATLTRTAFSLATENSSRWVSNALLMVISSGAAPTLAPPARQGYSTGRKLRGSRRDIRTSTSALASRGTTENAARPGVRRPGRAAGSHPQSRRLSFDRRGIEAWSHYFPSPPGRSGTFGMATSPLADEHRVDRDAVRLAVRVAACTDARMSAGRPRRRASASRQPAATSGRAGPLEVASARPRWPRRRTRPPPMPERPRRQPAPVVSARRSSETTSSATSARPSATRRRA